MEGPWSVQWVPFTKVVWVDLVLHVGGDSRELIALVDDCEVVDGNMHGGWVGEGMD